MNSKDGIFKLAVLLLRAKTRRFARKKKRKLRRLAAALMAEKGKKNEEAR